MPSRYLCDVLEDMRKQYETRNFSGLLGSIEQAQVMANRMEAALGDKRSLEDYDRDAASCNREIKGLKKDIKALNKEVADAQAHKKKLVSLIKQYRHIAKKETRGGKLLPVELQENCSVCGRQFIQCECNG